MAPDRQVRRLLLIDEDTDLAVRVGGLLASWSRPAHRLARYTHLPDALTYLKVSPADLVLVGPSPAGCDPIEAVRGLGAAFPEVPVLVLVAGGDAGRLEELRAAGALDCLPVDTEPPELWRRTIEFCLREAATRQELATVTARLDWLAHTDALTGMLNRHGMERVLLAELARCRADDRQLPVLLVDLDDFSRINATLGHGVGDLVLGAASRRIGESLGSQDRVGRCGTDRFVILLPGGDVNDAAAVAERIRLAVGRDTIQAGDHVLTTTASIGVTAIQPDSLSFDEVLAKAHFALQRSKLEGKNRVSRAASVEEIGLIRPVAAGPEMVQALLRGNVLEVASQPIVNLADGRIVSREMLVRGPRGPLRRPDHLFRYCQEMDILTAVDLRCLKRCAAAAAGFPDGGGYHVNIMPATLLQTPAQELIRVLQAGDPRRPCTLELSEQQLLGDPGVLVPRVRLLQEAGIRLGIDDVGFGNSCLEGLIMLQPQVMKVDKRLVRGLGTDAQLRRALVRLLKVADVLGAEVVAEGIETADDYQVLLDLGVRYGQGYLFGKPALVRSGRAAAVAGEPTPEDAAPGARAEA